MSKYEKLIEYIINDEEDKARQLFHEIVVEKSREIYESLMDEDEMYEMGHGYVGGDPVESLVDEVTGDEEGMQEAADDDMDMDMDMDADMGAELDDVEGDMGAMDAEMDAEQDMEGDIQDRVMDLEDALDELKAEFDTLMADEGDADMGDADDEDSAEDEEDVEDSDEEDQEEALQEARAKKDDKKKKLMDADKKNMSEAARLREYTEKLGDIYKQDPAKGEGHEVGKGGSVSVDKKSIVAGKNDMGGTTANIVKGGTEQDPDNKPVPEPKNEYSKGKTEVKDAKEWKNKVGGSTGSFKQKAPAAKTGEEGGTNNRSPLAK